MKNNMQGCYLFLGGSKDGERTDDIEPVDVIYVAKIEAIGYVKEAYYRTSISTQERIWHVYVYNNDKKILTKYIDGLNRQTVTK